MDLDFCNCFERKIHDLLPKQKLYIPVNCISHSLTLSICMLERSVRSSYSLRKESSDIENVARAREASRPANKPYGPPERN